MIFLIIVLRTPEEVKACLLFNKHYAPIVINSEGRKTEFCLTLEHDLPDFWSLEQQMSACSPLSFVTHISNHPSIKNLAIRPHKRQRDVVFLKDLVSYLGSNSILLQTRVSGQFREGHNIGENFSHEHYCPFTAASAKLSDLARQMNLENWCVAFIPKRLCTVCVNAHVAWTMLTCAVNSPVFRWRLLHNFRRQFQRLEANQWGSCESDLEVPVAYMLDIVSVWPVQHIDYAWNWYINHILAKRMLLEEAMAWLSTLGGAHSSLGEYFHHHAEKAGEISLTQLKLAVETGDPLTVGRCHMFWAFSLMQRGFWRKAKVIVRRVYKLATTHSVCDNRLINMCLSAWARLQHLHRLHWRIKTAADCARRPNKCRATACALQNGPTNSRVSVAYSTDRISNASM